MSFLRYFFDYFQIGLAIYVLIDTYRIIGEMTKTRKNLRPFELKLLEMREMNHYSPKQFMISRSFIVLLFLVLQIEWSLDKDSWSLSLGHDSSWFFLGVLVTLNWYKGNRAQTAMWKLITSFREKAPPCGVETCPIEEGLENDS